MKKINKLKEEVQIVEKISEGMHGWILQSIADGIYVTDKKRKVIYWNKSAEIITGYPKEFAIGKYCNSFMKHQDEKGNELCEIACPLIKAMDTKEHVSIEVVNFIRTTGEKKYISISVAPVVDLEKNIVGAVEVFRDITKEKEIEKMKSSFISIVSHELRTPLTSLLGFSEILLIRDVDEEKKKEFLKIINSESQRLVDLVNDVLDLSRIESGRLELKKQEIDIGPIIKNVIEMLKVITQKHNFIIEIPENLPLIFADREKVLQILQNIIDNAIKYSPEGGNIDIKIEKESNEFILVSISDEGLGISEQEIGKIFQPFYRIKTQQTEGIRGTGLGLSIVKNLIEMHNGNIWVKSPGEKGKGTTFYFTLPVVR